jgi:hypothetical protein
MLPDKPVPIWPERAVREDHPEPNGITSNLAAVSLDGQKAIIQKAHDGD